MRGFARALDWLIPALLIAAALVYLHPLWFGGVAK
jgi:hypothetical protein